MQHSNYFYFWIVGSRHFTPQVAEVFGMLQGQKNSPCPLSSFSSQDVGHVTQVGGGSGNRALSRQGVCQSFQSYLVLYFSRQAVGRTSVKMCRRHAGRGLWQSGGAEDKRNRQLSLRLHPLPSSRVFEAPEASPGLFQACPIGHGGLPRGVAPHTYSGHPHLLMSEPWYWELTVSLFPPRGLNSETGGGLLIQPTPLPQVSPCQSLCPISETPYLRGH